MPSRLRPLGVLLDLERPQLRTGGHGRRRPLGLGVAAGERSRRRPRVERLVVTPAGVDEPRLPAVGGTEQLELLEALGLFDLAGARREPACQLVGAVDGDGDGIDLDDGHRAIMSPWATGCGSGCWVACPSRIS